MDMNENTSLQTASNVNTGVAEGAQGVQGNAGAVVTDTPAQTGTQTASSNDLYLEDNEFRLPVGFVDREGRLHETIKLTPMTGATDEAIADPKVRENGGKVVTELIYSVAERLGSITKINKDTIRALTIPDRDFILVKNKQVSIGDDLEYVDSCPHCRAKNEINRDLSEIQVKYMDKDAPREITFDLIDGVKNNQKQVCKTITIVMNTGIVQEKIAPIAKVNPAQATTTMLRMITKKIDGMDMLNSEIFKAMTKRDRNLILKKMNEFEAGVDLTSTVECASCGEEYTSIIPVMMLLGE